MNTLNKFSPLVSFNNLNNNSNNASNNTNQQASNQEKTENDKAFLERTGVKAIIDGLIESLQNNQPEDSIDFICN